MNGNVKGWSWWMALAAAMLMSLLLDYSNTSSTSIISTSLQGSSSLTSTGLGFGVDAAPLPIPDEAMESLADIDPDIESIASERRLFRRMNKKKGGPAPKKATAPVSVPPPKPKYTKEQKKAYRQTDASREKRMETQKQKILAGKADQKPRVKAPVTDEQKRLAAEASAKKKAGRTETKQKGIVRKTKLQDAQNKKFEGMTLEEKKLAQVKQAQWNTMQSSATAQRRIQQAKDDPTNARAKKLADRAKDRQKAGFTESAKYLDKTLRANGADYAVTGGYAINKQGVNPNRRLKDIDIATNQSPDQIKALGNKLNREDNRVVMIKYPGKSEVSEAGHILSKDGKRVIDVDLRSQDPSDGRPNVVASDYNRKGNNAPGKGVNVMKPGVLLGSKLNAAMDLKRVHDGKLDGQDVGDIRKWMKDNAGSDKVGTVKSEHFESFEKSVQTAEGHGSKYVDGRPGKKNEKAKEWKDLGAMGRKIIDEQPKSPAEGGFEVTR